MIKKVFLTGGDGFLGSNLVEELLERSYEVTVLVQPGRSTGLLSPDSVHIVEGDLLDREQMIRETAGHDALIHIAAITDVFPSKGPHYWQVNVVGTQNMIDACLHHGMQRMVHCSSASSFRFGSKEAPGTEAAEIEVGTSGLDYIDSKLEGQRAVLRAVVESQLPALVVNPTFMIGPKDTKPSSGAFLIAAVSGKLPGYTRGGKNWVYVKDVAVGIANALAQGRIGECYILGSQNLSFGEALNLIEEATGLKVNKRQLPDYLALAAGRLGSLGSSYFGIRPKLTTPMAYISLQGHYFSPHKAIRELDLPQTPLVTAFQESYEWFREHQYVK